MAREVSAGAVVYRITEDGHPLYLLLQPTPNKPWGFPKGKIDAGESEAAAARREIAEEAGLTEIDFEENFRHVVHYVYRHGRSLVKKDVIYFLARAHTAEIHLSFEHVAFRWTGLTDGLDLLLYENARETLERAHAYLAEKYGFPLH